MKRNIKTLIFFILILLLLVIPIDVNAIEISEVNSSEKLVKYDKEHGKYWPDVTDSQLQRWRNAYDEYMDAKGNIINKPLKEAIYSISEEIQRRQKKDIDEDSNLESLPLAEEFKSDDYSFWKPKSSGNYSEVRKIGGKITGFIQVIGSVFSLLALVIIGIKYMLGSAEEKADYKKTMIPYIVGCIMVFACTALPKIIYNIAIKF